VLRFILRRVLSAIPSLFGLMIVTFLLIRIVPADPAAALAGDNATPQQIAEIRHQYGLDRPIYEQLALYIGQALRFNFGESQYSHRPVGLDIQQRLPATLELTFAALFIAIVGGIPLGVIAGVSHNR
jgi:peptide/nickel transport system permease protein